MIPTSRTVLTLIILANVILEFACHTPSKTTQVVIQGEPELTIKELPLNMGRTPGGITKYFWFHYKNSGTGPLVIDSISAPCSCTSGILHKRILSPGGADSMKMVFHPGGNFGRYTGEFTLYIKGKRQPVLVPFYLDIY